MVIHMDAAIPVDSDIWVVLDDIDKQPILPLRCDHVGYVVEWCICTLQ